MYASIGSGSGASDAGLANERRAIVTAAVATAKAAIRTRAIADRPQGIAAAIIDNPMALRMSTFRKLSEPPAEQLRLQAKEKREDKICSRANAPCGAAGRDRPDARADADIASASPARNRNSGEARPAMNTV